jgi:hypothetical protein
MTQIRAVTVPVGWARSLTSPRHPVEVVLSVPRLLLDQGRNAADLRTQMTRHGPLDYSSGKRYEPVPAEIARWFWRDS